MKTRDILRTTPLREHVAAISCGICSGSAVLDLDCAGTMIRMRVAHEDIPCEGTQISITARPQDIHLFDPTSGKRL